MTSWPRTYLPASADDSADVSLEEDDMTLESHGDWTAHRRRFWASTLAAAGVVLVVFALGTSGLPASLAVNRTQNLRPLQRYAMNLPEESPDNDTAVFDDALRSVENEEEMDAGIGHLDPGDNADIEDASNTSEEDLMDMPSDQSPKGVLMDLRSNWHRLSGFQKDTVNRAMASLKEAQGALQNARSEMLSGKTSQVHDIKAQTDAKKRLQAQIIKVLRTVMQILKTLYPWRYHRYGKTHRHPAYGSDRIYMGGKPYAHDREDGKSDGSGKAPGKVNSYSVDSHKRKNKAPYGYDRARHGKDKPGYHPRNGHDEHEPGYDKPNYGYGYTKPKYGYDKPRDGYGKHESRYNKPRYSYGEHEYGYDEANYGYGYGKSNADKPRKSGYKKAEEHAYGYQKPSHHDEEPEDFSEKPCSPFQCGVEPTHCPHHLSYCFRVSLASGETAPYDVMIGAACAACDSDADCQSGRCAESTCCRSPGGRTCLPDSAFGACNFQIDLPEPETTDGFDWSQASLPFQNMTEHLIG